MSNPPLVTNSFKTPYVSLDLLSYLKSDLQVTPFQIFNEVMMPGFEEHISNGHKNSNKEDTQTILREIMNDLIPISKACGILQKWQDGVSRAIENLAYQSLDDASRERTETQENTNRDNHLDKLNRTRSIVSELKKYVCFDLDSLSKEISKLFDTPVPGEDSQPLKTDNSVASTKFQAIYDGLEKKMKDCLLCFSMFPENAVIKKKVLIHWWVGEGFIDNLDTAETAEQAGNKCFQEFLEKDIIVPSCKGDRPSADSCMMQPHIRHAVIKLAKKEGFFDFDRIDKPTEDSSCSKRTYLVRTIEGSNVRELPFHSNPEKVQSLINVNEPHLYFRPKWFSKMKSVKVLQLGKWQKSAEAAETLIEVEDCEFLKGLKNMRELRYLSLRGISRITELPASICKARNLRILNLNGCCDLEKLPHGIGSLKNLTHLDMYECYLISGLPEGLALLSNLQVLKGFVSSTRSRSNDCKLDDLSKLENLRKLSIRIDRDHSDTAERELKSLAKFKKLRSLSISWSPIYVAPATQTLQKLRTLTKKLTRAKGFKGIKNWPSILAPESPLSAHLEKLDLHYCPHSQMPKWLAPTLLSNLKKLYIRGGRLSDLGQNGIKCQWDNVQTVRLMFLEELEMNWEKLQELFPKLSYLEIVECPRLLDQCDKFVWKKEDSEQAESTSPNV
ncbi:disease resistance RPP13-like protein 4 [Argentina anserina]|uniref:disease resistance RPP13-like protein 4 n=1 Tax=Argentina anserina TaxID=57926 RepID=UPI0021768BCB|nr:disease resistance RPP13-like protein 4 [Potentilla anserina]